MRLGRLVRGRRLAGVRGRVALLLLVAAVPLLLLALVIVLQNAQVVAGTAMERAAGVRAAAAARVSTVLDGTRRLLGSIAVDPDVVAGDLPACARALARARAAVPDWLESLLVVDTEGRLRCAAGPESDAPAAARAARAMRAFGRHVAETTDAPSGTLEVASERRGTEGFAGAAVAVPPPRVAVYGSWRPTSDEGWLRYVLDRFGQGHTLLRDADILNGGLERFTHIVLPALRGRDLVHGLGGDRYPPAWSGGLGRSHAPGDHGHEAVKLQCGAPQPLSQSPPLLRVGG
jgi:hypothetical protein